MPIPHDILGLSPFEGPDAALVLAVARTGALGVLDLGHDVPAGRAALAHLARHPMVTFAVRVPEYRDDLALELPTNATIVVVPASTGRFTWGERRVLAQVTSVAEALAATAAGVAGIIVKGHEASGRVGEETTFVLLQRVLGAVRVPVWAQGGIGLHTAAACLAAGARGVVVDSQLALLEEASTSPELRKAIAAMDGSETVVTAGYRLYARPGARSVDLGASPEHIASQLGHGSPAEHLVTMGQDAAFARPIAERFATVDRFVGALRTAVDGHLRQARALRSLARHAPLAQELGTVFPIVQGPMTRVSDRAPFAEAVALGGAMPFLALALMRGEEARSLLDETRARLADRPWGVGILGFVPPDLREEQLAMVREARPRVAIIAGGRPSQAKPLEDAGIATFLHVPSPGLLDVFLKDGARRFVFEGRECGGHVGPRSSFVLWESAIERLLACERLDDVSVLFAGGIHDALSARMVAVLAAPLAARGAHVGVLMGTAYLFTEEAVASGAIGQAFQDAAQACRATALVETAPGHSTRCSETEFVRAFERERERLVASGADAQTVWAALETLNLGRLRIASKGIRREGDRLVQLDESEQHREGMFMIGQVAALRSARCTIDELHRDVSDRSTADLAALPHSAVRRPRPRGAIDIAIVGAACIFADAPDLDTFWSNVVCGRTSIREVSPERWDPAIYFDPKGTGEKTPSKWGAFLSPSVFDPALFGIPPRSLASIDPAQLLALEVARRALDDAGCSARPFDRERVGVIFGGEAGSDLGNAYAFRASFPTYVAGAMPPALDAALPKLTEDSFPGVLSNVISGRIASRLDLRGSNFTVDAACASSLAAVDAACKELTSGFCDMVIAGGADLHNSVQDFMMFASAHALSATGQCRPFDAHADGTALGEGVAAVVLKRLEDAERDGDRIYAVIQGVGGSSDGKSLGLTAPRKEGQLRALERAYERAGVSPAEVGLVEAHGTGTFVGDRTELSALTEAFGASGALAASCTLGSVKSQIGHTKCAAGMAGLIKAALAVHHGVLPATKNVSTPSTQATSPFVLRDAAAPWTADRRLAGVSAFGFGGANFHVVLSSHGAQVPATPAIQDWPAELVVIRGEADEAAALLDALDRAAAGAIPPKLRDLAATAARTHGAAAARFAFVATSLTDLRTKIAAARSGDAGSGVLVAGARRGEVAFVFPGQGSQSAGMLSELFVVFPQLRELAQLGRAYADRMFPGGAYTVDAVAAQRRAITDTRVAQPALGIAGLAVARLLEHVGVRPDMVGGHSYGELVALAVAGSFDADTLLALSAARARCILDAAGAAPGTMAAVRASLEQVRAVLGETADGVVVANHNAPDQVVLAGSGDAVARACESLAAGGFAAKSFPVACAFHSPIVAAASDAFGLELAAADVYPPSVPVFANSTASRYGATADDVRATLAAQLALPVRFVEQIEAMYAAGARVFVEAGPGGVLTDLVSRILRGRPHTTVACASGEGQGLAGLLGALARLVEAGVSVNTAPLFAGRGKTIDLAASFDAPATVWRVDGQGARPVHGELPETAMRPLARRIALNESPVAVPATGDDREGTVRDFLRTMREMADTQRDVLLQYLGAEPGAAPARRSRVFDMQPEAAPSAPLLQAARKDDVPAVALSPLEALVATVGERTGYPPEMLDPDLDLEADLGIDSIKRLEIVAAIRDRLGLRGAGGDQDAMIEKLAGAKTLRGLATLLDAQRPGGANGAHANGSQTNGAHSNGTHTNGASAPAANAASVANDGAGGLERYIVDIEPVAAAEARVDAVDAQRFVITPDPFGIAGELSALLIGAGALARVIAPGEAVGDVDGFVSLATIGGETPDDVRALFLRAKEAVRGGAKWLVAASELGGRFGHHAHTPREAPGSAGISGLLKSISKEHPSMHVRVVDLMPSEDAAALARYVFDEIVATDRRLEVGYVGGVRHAPVVARRISSLPPPSPVVIDASSVILITGGARGITGQIALAMARRYRCKLELVGRSHLDPDEEDAELRQATDAADLRRLLVVRMNGAGRAGPAAIEAQCKQILAAREIRAVLAGIREAGGRADYHAVDVRDDEAFGALIDRLRARGRIDGVIHGAGLIEDKLIADKSHESFDRVFSTKVAGARTLARKLASDVGFFVLFSSVSGAFGNRGQTDYAAANDALDKLAHKLHGSVPGRVLSINWGPWRGVGMVRPELEREYAKMGVGLIAPETGVQHFFDELLAGSDPQAILTAAQAEALS